MPAARSRVIYLKVTPEQHALAARRRALDLVSWQAWGSAALNAYILGHLVVHPDGRFEVSPEGDTDRLVFREDAEAQRRQVEETERRVAETLTKPPPPPKPYLDTREAARLVEERTGRRVSLPLFRVLLRERWPGARAPSGRYRFDHGDPVLDEVTRAVADGALDEIRDRRFKSFGGPTLPPTTGRKAP